MMVQSPEDSRYCAVCQAAYPAEFSACPRDGTLLEGGTDRLIGAELRDTYKITHVIGEGALGRVYHASHIRVARSYAVKVPRGVWIDHPKARLRFFNEAAAAGRLQHPNIANVVDHGETATGMPYLVMELAPGAPLRELISPLGIPARTALGLVRQIAAGLAHAHAHGVVHRDLKPDNVLVEGELARIVDFGIAILTDLGDEGRFTTKGMTIGSPHYMAPEQLIGARIDARADLYALGAILYELLAGCKPYTGTTVEYVHRVVEGKLPAFSDRVPWLAIDAGIEALCRQLLAVRPEDRPADADAVIAELDRLVVGVARDPASPQGVAIIENLASSPTVPATTTIERTERVRVRWWNPLTWWRR